MSLDVSLIDGVCDHCGRGGGELFTANITHNLNNMAAAAGLYKACWHPEDNGWTKAKDIVPVLRQGLAWLTDHPDEARKHDAPNGWGLYKHFVPWVRYYLEACEAHPEATIRVER